MNEENLTPFERGALTFVKSTPSPESSGEWKITDDSDYTYDYHKGVWVGCLTNLSMALVFGVTKEKAFERATWILECMNRKNSTAQIIDDTHVDELMAQVQALRLDNENLQAELSQARQLLINQGSEKQKLQAEVERLRNGIETYVVNPKPATESLHYFHSLLTSKPTTQEKGQKEV
jgi:hypothetical protein